MSIVPFLIAVLLVRSIRNTLKTFNHPKKWDQWANGSNSAIVFIFIIQIIFRHEHIFDWIWDFILLAIVGIIYQEEQLHPVKAFGLSIVPYVVVSLIKNGLTLFSSEFDNKWSGYVGTAQAFAIVWIFASWFTSNRQQKAMEKEREKRRQEEELNRAIAARKVELEAMVKERTAALQQQKEELQHALAELRTTQDQLIQSEKLASLGELTAGIAHEIQNPLNFVNNFSEVSAELVDEMEEELEKGDVKEASAIAADIKQNLEKIRHHGKRADGIVKGMLQHSRNNSGERQLTDINNLADEYLRLSYHGLRAKDKTFNATMTTHFAENLPKINIVPQDIGRVLLNLFNNAFYATQQKQKTAGAAYKPEVTVSTSFTDTFLEIKVKDNGMGIPEEIQDKILQPFFTTKPTGEGTGLGLSLSYDIVVKGHSGSININSKEGVGSEFIINLPLRT
ncbi:sensor histidine kinase [Mucilaginibacter arboris]|uniref:histidine kinase n=1 Tax=Mucilaginibacter arboris TaxID=2682090 RepID=A0A7K1SWM2_9SPHI|nr:ATP-binding protein [Mucilaginibacter arboris]MVN21460.1 histidine kinase [Mucilaginibacter arboris]